MVRIKELPGDAPTTSIIHYEVTLPCEDSAEETEIGAYCVYREGTIHVTSEEQICVCISVREASHFGLLLPPQEPNASNNPIDHLHFPTLQERSLPKYMEIYVDQICFSGSFGALRIWASKEEAGNSKESEVNPATEEDSFEATNASEDDELEPSTSKSPTNEAKEIQGSAKLPVNPKLRHKCSFCQKLFISSSRRRRHERVHTGERPFKCRFCPKTFTQTHIRKTHEVAHTGRYPYLCMFCPKMFAKQEYLKEHERTHTGERPYACSHCPKAFSQRTSRKLHEKKHLEAAAVAATFPVLPPAPPPAATEVRSLVSPGRASFAEVASELYSMGSEWIQTAWEEEAASVFGDPQPQWYVVHPNLTTL